MGSAPGLAELWWQYGIKVMLIYCFGTAFTTFYRLVGPYRHSKAPSIVETEIYDTIQHRGVVGNLMMGVIPMAFCAEKALNVATMLARPFLIQPHKGQRRHGNRRFQSDYAPVAEVDSPMAQGRQRGNMLRLFALFASLFTVVSANTEINNFGPVLCRTDEYGHLTAKAAEQLSASWPVIGVESVPSMFTIMAEEGDEREGSRKGAWVVLDVSQGTKLPHEGGSPRDLWLWKVFKRYTVRMSWSANVPLDVNMEVHSPESALRAGGVEWAAEKIQEMVSVPVAPGQTAPASAYSVIPKETQPSLPAEPAATVTLEREARILASESVGMDAEPGQAPCERVFLHLMAIRNGVPVPQPKGTSYFKAPGDGQLIPIHLTLEKWHLGFLPATALQMGAIMLPVLVVGWWVVRPRFEQVVRGWPDKKTE